MQSHWGTFTNNMTIKQFISKLLHLIEVRRIKTNKKVVYLTFDDAPEGEITNFVLSYLAKYNAKATFFCRGDNAEKNPEMLKKIINEGHAVGNHTYSHIRALSVSNKEYIDNIERANILLKTHLFRPPWGVLKLSDYRKLISMGYKIIYWSLTSGDTELDKFDLSSNLERMKNSTKPGDIVLFHSVNRHENETKQILPQYLAWLYENGYKSKELI